MFYQVEGGIVDEKITCPACASRVSVTRYPATIRAECECGAQIEVRERLTIRVASMPAKNKASSEYVPSKAVESLHYEVSRSLSAAARRPKEDIVHIIGDCVQAYLDAPLQPPSILILEIFFKLAPSNPAAYNPFVMKFIIDLIPPSAKESLSDFVAAALEPGYQQSTQPGSISNNPMSPEQLKSVACGIQRWAAALSSITR